MRPEILYPVVLAIGVFAFGIVCWILAHSYQGKRRREEERARVLTWRLAEIAGERRIRQREQV